MHQPSRLTVRELLRHGLSSICDAYDQIAPKFDATPFRTPREVIEAMLARIAPAGPVDSILDIGCGTGAVTEAVEPLCRRVLVGLDLSLGMLQVARRRIAGSCEHARIVFCRGNALAMPFQRVFDLVVSAGMLVHIPCRQQSRFVAEVARVLRPGGRFVFVTVERPPRLSLPYAFWKTFNGLMHMRNLLGRSPFPLTQLNFSVDRAAELLSAQGFEVDIRRNAFGAAPHRRGVVVVATLPSTR